jgi:Zn-dependent oligopeptidase
MTSANNQPKTIGKLIDTLDRIREELMTIQRALEKLESIKTVAELQTAKH